MTAGYQATMPVTATERARHAPFAAVTALLLFKDPKHPGA